MDSLSLLQPSLPSCQSLLSDDANYCFVPGLPLSIHTYSTRSSALVNSFSLPFQNPDDRLVAIHLHPRKPAQLLLLVSSLGSIFIFDFLNNALVASFQTHLSLLFSALPNPARSSASSTTAQSPFTLFVVAKKTAEHAIKAKQKTFKHLDSLIYALQLTPPPTDGPDSQGKFRSLCLLKMPQASAFVASACGNWLGAVAGTSIWLVRLTASDLFASCGDSKQPKRTRFQTVRLTAPEPITAIAFPPKAHADHFGAQTALPTDVSSTPCDFFATGSVSGKIALWHALSEAQWAALATASAQTPSLQLACPTSVGHWHAHAVADLAFTRNGAYLLSGGEEAVLVLWRLDYFSGIGTDSKTFLPRLASPITRIALVDRLESHEPGALVTTQDGTLLLVNTATMALVRSLKLPKMHRLPAVYAQRTGGVLAALAAPRGQPNPPYGCLVLQASAPCALQVLDGGTGDVLSEIFVTPKNTVSRRDTRPVVEPALLHLALGGVRDEYMATIDAWHDQERGFSQEVTLKLWERDEENPYQFNVIGRVDNPHEAEITSLAISPGKVPTIVTTALDGSIKLWTSSSAGPRASEPARAFEWLRATQLSYRGLEALGCAFAADGTVLAVIHGACVTLWDVRGQRLLRTLASGSQARLGKFCKVDFVGGAQGKLVVVGSLGVGIFELLGGAELGFWACRARHLVKNPSGDKVVVFHQKERKACKPGSTAKAQAGHHELLVIDVALAQTVLRMRTRPVSGAVFVATVGAGPSGAKEAVLDGLVLVSETAGLTRFGTPVAGRQSLATGTAAVERQAGIASSLVFSDALGTRQTLPEGLVQAAAGAHEQVDDVAESIIHLAPHLVPPSRMIWTTFIQPRRLPSIKPALTPSEETPNQSGEAEEKVKNVSHPRTSDAKNSVAVNNNLSVVEFQKLVIDKLRMLNGGDGLIKVGPVTVDELRIRED